MSRAAPEHPDLRADSPPPSGGARVLVYELLRGGERAPLVGRAIAVFLAGLIILNVIAVALETVESLHRAWARAFHLFDVCSVAVFTLEYALRLWACTVNPRYAAPVTGRLRYALRPLMLVDLLAVAPAYCAGLLVLDLRILRLIRLFRLLRILKIARYSESLQLLGRVLVAKRAELLVTLAAVMVLLVIASTVMYYVEHDEQPEVFSSIPATMWWGIETLTTIGYGDVVPKSVLGKVVNSCIALLGIGLFALPAGILGSGFVEELHNRRRSPACCPHCGKPLERG